MPYAAADGCGFSDHYYHMNMPNQKAVITWDGTTETMVLSTALRGEDLSNMAWVVPIQSKTKPEISEGNLSVFNIVIDHFTPIYDSRWGMAYEESMAPGDKSGVEVIESKEVDIYDITILKATDAQELVDWLNAHKYLVPETAAETFQVYCDKEDFYFVANRIDLSNKYASTMSVIKSHFTRVGMSEDVRQEKMYYIIDALLSDKEDVCDNIAFDIARNIPYGDYSEWWSDRFIISESDYERLRTRYAYTNSSAYFWDEKETSQFQHVSENVCDEIYSGLFSLDKEQLWDLYEMYSYEFEEGVSTPLKFEFQPSEPFYPMEISSINEGWVLVEVYVFADKPVEDKNEIMYVDEYMAVSSSLSEEMGEYLEMEDMDYVTRLRYSDELKSLSADTVFETFEPQDPTPCFLTRIWRWWIGLF